MIGSALRPWRTSATWRALAFVTTSMIVGVVGLLTVIAMFVMTLVLLLFLPLALLVGWLRRTLRAYANASTPPRVGLETFVVANALGRLERSRIAAFLGVELGNPHLPLPPAAFIRRYFLGLKSGSRLREIAYFALLLPGAFVTFVVTIGLWCFSLALIPLPLYVHALPGNSAELGLFEIGAGAPALVAGFLGLCGVVLLAPWTTVGFGAAWRLAGRRMLGPSPAQQRELELARAEASRVAAVDSAETERRRIERDLHDGAQARLVGVAMDLGRAEEYFDQDPARARALVATAHRETRAALSELRDLVRGFHPAILEDRGLDAALSAVVARLPMPVSLRIDIPERPPSTVESAAYFVVVEALTNVAKHSGATAASVSIARRGDRLAIDVTDDGRGGAVASPGSGLEGMDERVQGLSGWMHVLSPDGGPTTVLVELPCAS